MCVELGRQASGHRPFAAGEQLHRAGGIRQAPAGVQSGPEPESDRVDGRLRDAAELEERPHARSRIACHLAKAVFHEHPVLLDERHEVGDGAERRQVEIATKSGTGPPLSRSSMRVPSSR